MKPEVGAVLSGTLCLTRKLAEGGMGSVWIAEHLVLGTEVAVKFMASSSEEAPGARSRFFREARITASVNSPHVVRVLDCRSDASDEPYLVLELLDGETLERLVLRHGPLPIPFVVEVVAQLCAALTASHAAGVVHRDLKPENVFVVAGEACLVKLLDFGISKPMARSDCLEVDHVPAGTPRYMSPEHLFDPGGTDARSDLFSLASVAYFALTGETPFPGKSLDEIYVAIDKGVFRRPSELRPDVPSGLDRWFEKALSTAPVDRFGCARQMAVALTDANRPCEEPRAVASRPTAIRKARNGIVAAMLLAALGGVVAWYERTPTLPSSAVADRAPR